MILMFFIGFNKVFFVIINMIFVYKIQEVAIYSFLFWWTINLWI